MDLRPIYLANGIGIVILLQLQYVSRVKLGRRQTEDRLYTLMVLGVMLGCIMETFSYTLDGRLFPGARLLNHIANTYLFTANLLLPFCVIAYVDLGLYGDLSRIPRKYRPQIAVGCVFLAANIVNLFVPLSYRISEENVYERMPFGYAYYLVILYYCLTGLAVNRRYEKANGARTFLRVNMFLLPILAGAGLQFMFYGLSLAWLSSAVGLTGLFMMQQNEVAYVDSLADIYNRQYMNHILSAWTSRGRSFAGIMVDIDRFKSINDVFGHSEGDQALRTVADLLKRSRTSGEFVFRFAGDEFVVLKLSDDPAALTPYLEALTRNLAARNAGEARYPLSLSWGGSFYRSGSVDDFMKEMDREMYAMKEAHHLEADIGGQGCLY